MGRQWLHAKRAIVNLKKGQVVQKLVKEITVAAKLGGGDVDANARLHAAVEKAKKASVTRDVIQRAIAKGAGTGGESASLEHVVYEGYAPHKVPVIVDAGVGTASEAARAMELGVEGVMMQTAIAQAQEPVSMADAMKHAVIAGRLAYLSGRIPRKMYATASSPVEGLVGR